VASGVDDDVGGVRETGREDPNRAFLSRYDGDEAVALRV